MHTLSQLLHLAGSAARSELCSLFQEGAGDDSRSTDLRTALESGAKRRVGRAVASIISASATLLRRALACHSTRSSAIAIGDRERLRSHTALDAGSETGAAGAATIHCARALTSFHAQTILAQGVCARTLRGDGSEGWARGRHAAYIATTAQASLLSVASTT